MLFILYSLTVPGTIEKILSHNYEIHDSYTRMKGHSEEIVE